MVDSTSETQTTPQVQVESRKPNPTQQETPQQKQARINNAIAVDFLRSFQQAFRRDLNLSEMKNLGSEAWQRLPTTVKQEVGRLLIEKQKQEEDERKSKKALEEQRLIVAAESHAQHFLQGYKQAFGRMPTLAEAQNGIPNEAYRNLSQYAKEALIRIIGDVG